MLISSMYHFTKIKYSHFFIPKANVFSLPKKWEHYWHWAYDCSFSGVYKCTITTKKQILIVIWYKTQRVR